MKHTVITGHYGSGKTNIAVNMALSAAKTATKKIFLIDADIVNPFFRSADNTDILSEAGVEVIAPMTANTNLDIPAMPAEIMRVFSADCEVFWDIGGDETGAVALGRYAENIKAQGYEMLYVVNFYRPLTDSEDDMTELLSEIEASSRLKVSALADNSNLGEETTPDTLFAVKGKIESLSRRTGLEVKYTCVDERLSAFFPEAMPLKMVTKKLW